MKPIDQARLERYSKEGTCLACGAVNSLEYENLDVDGPWVSQDVACNECGATWKDNYKFHGVSGMTDKSDEFIGPDPDGDYYLPNYEGMIKSILKQKEVLPTLIGLDKELDKLIEAAMKK
jgi:hypothetical protein